MLPSGPRLVQRKWPIHYIIPGVMEVHVINLTINVFFYFSLFPQILPSRVKIKYNLNPKINTRSCVYTSIDNEPPTKNYSNETVKTVSIKITVVLSSKNCKVFIVQKHFTHSFVSIDDYPMSGVSN
jgi:hypothetical protein